MRVWLVAFLTALFVLGCLKMPWLAPSEPPLMRIQVTPRVCLVPCLVTARVFIRPSNANRTVCLQLDWQSSCWSLNGEHERMEFEPRVFRVTQAGEADVIATLYGVSATIREQIREPVTVQ